MGLKPFDAYIVFKYKCPDCEEIHWLQEKEAKTSGFKVVCCKSHEIETIANFVVRINFTKKQTSIISKAHKVLKTHGFTLKDIKEFQSRSNAKNSAELIKQFLKEQ